MYYIKKEVVFYRSIVAIFFNTERISIKKDSMIFVKMLLAIVPLDPCLIEHYIV